MDEQASDVDATWRQIEFWLEAKAPAVLRSLRPGATEQQIRAAEEALGVVFPDEVRRSFRVHDGQEPDGPGLMDACELLSLGRILDEFGVWKGLLDAGEFDEIRSEPGPGIRDDWWNSRWIPLSSNYGGDHRCLDLDPEPGGRAGQVISFWHEWESRRVLWPSFGHWLATLAEGLESGSIVFSEEDGGLVRRADEEPLT